MTTQLPERVFRCAALSFATFACAATTVLAKPYTFVAFHDQNQVGVYDHGTSTWLAPITVGANPVAVAADAIQRKLYVSNHRAHSVSIVLIANRANVGSISLPSGAQPMGIVASPTLPRVYVANFGTNTVSVINTLTNAVISTISAGASPTGIAITPTGDRVFVANTGDNTISVIDTASNTVSQTINVTLPDNPQPRPYAVAFASGGSGRLVVANNNGAMATVFDGATYVPLGNIALGAHPTALGVVNGNKIYALNSTDATLSVIDPVALSVSAPIAVPAGAISIAVAPNTTLASLTVSPNQIVSINTSSNAVGAAITSPVAFKSALTLGGFVTNPGFECTLDLNANGVMDHDDRSIVTRYLLGLRGSGLVAGLGALNAPLIEAQLASLALDADNDSSTLATTDGLLINRATRGIVGPALIANARNTSLATPPLRTASQILQWMIDNHGVNCTP